MTHPYYLHDDIQARIQLDKEMTFGEIADKLHLNESQFRANRRMRGELMKVQKGLKIGTNLTELAQAITQTVMPMLEFEFGGPATEVWLKGDAQSLTKPVSHFFEIVSPDTWGGKVDADEMSKVLPLSAAKFFAHLEKDEGGTHFMSDGSVKTHVTTSHYNSNKESYILIEIGGIQRNTLDDQFPLGRELLSYETDHVAGMIVMAHNLMNTLDRLILSGYVKASDTIGSQKDAYKLALLAAEAWYGRGRNYQKLTAVGHKDSKGVPYPATKMTKSMWQLLPGPSIADTIQFFLTNMTRAHHPELYRHYKGGKDVFA